MILKKIYIVKYKILLQKKQNSKHFIIKVIQTYADLRFGRRTIYTRILSIF